MKTISSKDIKFYLKDPRADRPTLINIVYRYDNRKFTYSTSQTILPVFWSAESQCVRLPKGRKERAPYEAINEVLNRHSTNLQKVLNMLILSQTPFNNEVIKSALDTALQKTVDKPKKKVKENFLSFIERFITECESGVRLSNKEARYSVHTIKDFKKTLSHFRSYEHVLGKQVDYDTFTIQFFKKWKQHLNGQGYCLNSIGTFIKALKVLLKQAYRDGLHQNNIFEHEEMRKPQEDVDNIYLNNAELDLFYSLDLSNNSRLDRVRDLFLIGCYTGLRFGDFSELKPVNITHNGKLLTVNTSKTGERVTIPLSPRVLSILAKYEGVPPRAISNQKFNAYLKDVAKCAIEFADPFQTTRTKGGSRITTVSEKWKRVTTHTARRSFATNAYLAKVPTISIMKITGHRTETSFMKYIKITGEENAMLLLSHPHFQQNSLSIP